MHRLKAVASLLSAGTMGLSLAACGGSPDSEYCQLATSVNEDMPNLSGDPDKEAMDTVQQRFDELAAAAPTEVSDDWQKVAEGWNTISHVDRRDEESVDSAAAAAAEWQPAFDSVTDHAENECDIEFN